MLYVQQIQGTVKGRGRNQHRYYKKLPKMYFTNITGGEPFIREDLKEIVRELYKKATESLYLQTDFLLTESLIYARNFLKSVFVSRLKDLKTQITKSGA